MSVTSAPPLLCLETAESTDAINVLSRVKSNLHSFSDTANLADEWTALLGPLETDLFINRAPTDREEEDEILTSYHYDVDLLVVGISHQGCTWADICYFSQQTSSFKIVFKRDLGQAGDGFRAKFFEGNKSRPLWTLPQALIGKAVFGNFECDLIVFGPEDVSKSGFKGQIFDLLCESVTAAKSDPRLPRDCYTILNHLESDIRNSIRYKSSYSYAVSERTAVEFVLNNLQRRLSAKHHIMLVDLGCKSRSCTGGGADTKTLRSHSAVSSHYANSQGQTLNWHDSFREILSRHLNLFEVQSRATFILSDLGIEFSARGRFMHWDQQACKSFKAAMGGRGSLFTSFGIRQLANFDSRNTEFERYFFLHFFIVSCSMPYI